jgi:hypothetical protein
MGLWILTTGSIAPSWLGRRIGLAQVRHRDIPLPLGTGMSLGRSLRKLLVNSLFVFPGHQRCIEPRPLDEELRNRTVLTMMESALEHDFRHLEVIVDVGQRR